MQDTVLFDVNFATTFPIPASANKAPCLAISPIPKPINQPIDPVKNEDIIL